jgi:hypothetical protein
VERVAGVTPVEDDLVSAERPPARDREHLLEIVGRNVRKQRPVHV